MTNFVDARRVNGIAVLLDSDGVIHPVRWRKPCPEGGISAALITIFGEKEAAVVVQELLNIATAAATAAARKLRP